MAAPSPRSGRPRVRRPLAVASAALVVAGSGGLAGAVLLTSQRAVPGGSVAQPSLSVPLPPSVVQLPRTPNPPAAPHGADSGRPASVPVVPPRLVAAAPAGSAVVPAASAGSAVGTSASAAGALLSGPALLVGTVSQLAASPTGPAAPAPGVTGVVPGSAGPASGTTGQNGTAGSTVGRSEGQGQVPTSRSTAQPATAPPQQGLTTPADSSTAELTALAATFLQSAEPAGWPSATGTRALGPRWLPGRVTARSPLALVPPALPALMIPPGLRRASVVAVAAVPVRAVPGRGAPPAAATPTAEAEIAAGSAPGGPSPSDDRVRPRGGSDRQSAAGSTDRSSAEPTVDARPAVPAPAARAAAAAPPVRRSEPEHGQRRASAPRKARGHSARR